MLRETIREQQDRFTSRGISSALGTLAAISHGQEDVVAERNLMLEFVNHPKETVQIGAIRALGRLGDPAAQSVLETLAIKDGPSSRVASAAEDALKKVQESRPTAPTEVVELRKEITQVKESNEKLGKDIEELKSMLETLVKASKEPANDSEENGSEEEADTTSSE